MSDRRVPPPPTKFGPAAGGSIGQAKRPAVPLALPPPFVPPRLNAPPPLAGNTIQRAPGPAIKAPSGRLAPIPPPLPHRKLIVQRMLASEEADSDEEDVPVMSWEDSGLELRGGSQAGWALPGEKRGLRGARSYAGDRDRQLLRHFSSQLFFLAKARVSTTQEIQTMAAGGNLFVAANADAEIRSIYNKLKDDLANNLKAALTKEYPSDRSGAYWVHPRAKKQKATARFARKFAKLYDGTREAKLQSGSVAADPVEIWKAIKDAKIETLNGTSKRHVINAFAETGMIFLVLSGDDGRHAEEKLMDLLALAGHYGTVLVSGKKRPCKTCLGRLRYMVSKGYNVEHSQLPGFIWKERYTAQPEDVQKFTMEVIVKNQSYVTLRPKNKWPVSYAEAPKTYRQKTDFASDSESDDD